MLNAWNRRGKQVGFCWEIQKETDYQEDLDVGERIILE
jgi:hypothetical protein